MASRIFVFFSLAVLLLSAGPAFAQEDGPAFVTLKDLFSKALKNSETVAISDEAVRRSQALHRQTLGETFPEITYQRRATLEERAKTRHDGFFEVAKTSFTGYGEIAALKASGATAAQRRFERRRIEQLLLQDIAAAFYNLLLAEENARTTEKLVELAESRSTELEERVQLGKTRPADALGQKVLIGTFRSQLEESRRQVDARRDLLAFLVAEPRLEGKIEDSLVPSEPLSLEAYLATAQSRPDIEAARENLEAFKGLMEVTRAEFLPSFGASAAAYTDRSLSSNDVDWDVLFSMNVPIWNWGGRHAAMDAAGTDVAQSRDEMSLALRQAELDIRNAYRDLASAKRQREILESSVVAARQDYELQVKDDSQGLVTNLEVFESLGRLSDAELAYNSARLQEKLAVINLKVAAGSDPGEILQ
jgi:outer membrane protein